jgi:small conductance mechanosensitive channel
MMTWLETSAATLGPRILDWGVAVIGALLILIAGFIVAGWVARTANMVISRSDRVDPTVRTFVSSGLRYLIIAITFLAVLGKFGVQTASLVAVIGAAGLAIGLALQGTLSDVAAGVVLLVVRPFRVGDGVVAATHEGTVRAVTLFTTELTTIDNRKVVIPNSKVWAQPIINLTTLGQRRLDLPVKLDADVDINAAIAVIEAAIAADNRILVEPKPRVQVTGLSDGIELSARVWADPNHLIGLRSDLFLAFKTSLDRAGLKLYVPG